MSLLKLMDADDALSLLGQHPEVSIVVTDVQMPGAIDGLRLVEILAESYPHIQTLITSGRATPNEARQCGARRFLAKPYTAAAIQSAVASTIIPI